MGSRPGRVAVILLVGGLLVEADVWAEETTERGFGSFVFSGLEGQSEYRRQSGTSIGKREISRAHEEIDQEKLANTSLMLDPVALPSRVWVLDKIRQLRWSPGQKSPCSGVAGGACSRNLYVWLNCEESCGCVEDPALEPVPLTLELRGRMYVWGGDWPMQSVRPVDPTVVDEESARRHEYRFHIEKALAGILEPAESLNVQSFPSINDCVRKCRPLREKLQKQFWKILTQTQADELEGTHPDLKRVRQRQEEVAAR